MFSSAFAESIVAQAAPSDIRAYISQWLPQNATTEERTRAIEEVLRSPGGQMLRTELGKWIVEKFVPVESLVPEEYAEWRIPTRDAMLFVVSHLSDGRLAPKILEQIELPIETPPEIRLLRLISKVPGLQKLGQVLARNKHLRPSMRRALTQLENGIHDVTFEDIEAIVKRQLASKLARFHVQIEPKILSEASVSAVVRFTWLNPETRKRERGVFKVLKPYIPECFAEDMDFLHGLTRYFGKRYKEYGFSKNVLTDTFNKVRRLLSHEVRFRGEQRTLIEARRLYMSMPGIRVPGVIEPLCTRTITALTEEFGTKITDAVRHMPDWKRGQVAQQMIEALVALPLFSPEQSALFHADPHAGNLLYNAKTRELVILDWALTERLSRDQRRRLALLVGMVTLRDAPGVAEQIRALSQYGSRSTVQAAHIRRTVSTFFNDASLAGVPSAVDAMRLLHQVAITGVRFPAPLIMMSKVLFTLDGILKDINGLGVSMAFTIARHPLHRYVTKGASAKLPLSIKDVIALQCSALLFAGRLSIKLQEAILDKI